jgi:hypothetical protein
MPKAQTKIIEQAMYLCEKHDWTEAYKILFNYFRNQKSRSHATVVFECHNFSSS